MKEKDSFAENKTGKVSLFSMHVRIVNSMCMRVCKYGSVKARNTVCIPFNHLRNHFMAMP